MITTSPTIPACSSRLLHHSTKSLFVGGRDDDRELRVGDVGLGQVNDDGWIGAVDDPCTLAGLHLSQGGAEVTVHGHADHADAAQGLGRPRR
jgi:hypothetical protein